MVSCGEWSQDIIFSQTSKNVTYKTAIVCGSKIMIFHSNKQINHQIMIQTNSIVTSFTLNELDDIAYWTDGKTIYNSPINKSISIKVIILLNNLNLIYILKILLENHITIFNTVLF